MAQTGGVRLVQVHPHDPDTETDIDIIAIHGLDTKSPDTWIWKPNTSEQPNVNWLADSHMLPSKVGQARIFTCDWPADVLLRSDSIPMVLKEIARLLLAGINIRPVAANSQARRGDRPILFIASCLGGIILLQALVMADHDYVSVRRATRGIIFLATPFRGTSFQDVAKWAEPGLRAWAWTRGREVTKLLHKVKGPTFELSELVRSFTQLYRDSSHPFQVLTFYELGKTSLYRKIPLVGVIFHCLNRSKVLVDESSANLDIVADPLPLDRPHVMMNKFCGPEDPDYERVATKLEDILWTVRHGSPLEKADILIREQHYTADRLKIERLSGKMLSIDHCYINLAIVEQLGRKADRSEERDSVPQPSKSSLLARLRVETPIEEVRVELPTLFDQRERPDGRTAQPRRILIRGRAGVGKTTLCKKIVFDFIYHGIWKELFDRVLWVPLRRLKQRRDLQYNLEELFYAEYFSQQVEGRHFANELWRALDTHGSRTLFVLDGLDEVSQDLDRDNDMFRFLTHLLNQPNVIITSRPHAKLPVGVYALDLELETIGFYPDQVKEYLATVFDNDPKTVDEVQSFLDNHWLIQDLVRIPIQLDALCFTWDSTYSETIPQTLTDVYKAIEQKLWKKDVLRLGKKVDGELVTDSYIQGSHPSEIEDLVKDEIYFLEGLAFTGLRNDVIDFESRHRNVISNQFKLPMMTFLFDKTLPRLSFLRTSDPLPEYSNRSYHFLHLTFQEYFAARYFVRQWKAREPLKCLQLSDGNVENIEPAAFIRKHKYTRHYDVFWRFVAGLLDAEREALCFFQTIEEEPRDMLGPTHQRLVMYCLNEVYTSSVPIRRDLDQQLLQWLIFECDFARSARLASDVEFPEQVLETALQEGSEERKKTILWGVVPRPRIPPRVIKLAASWLGDDHTSGSLKMVVCIMLQRSHEDLSEAILQAVVARLEHPEENVRRAAVDALGGQSALPGPILQAVAALLEDPEGGVRQAAVHVLGGQSALPEPILQAVAARLGDPEGNVRWAAVDALGRQSTLPEPILQAVVARLEHPEEGIRRAAVGALGRQSTLPEPILQAVVARLGDPEGNVRWAAVDALGRQSALPEPILQAVVARLEHPEEGIRRAAVDALGGQSALPEPILQAVAARLGDPEGNVRWAAVDALGRQSTLPEPILQAVAARLGDPEENVRWAAVDALGRQLTLPEPILQAVAERLGNPDECVRLAAVAALRHQSTLSEPILRAVAARLDDTDMYVRWATVDTLGRQSTLPEAILQAVVERIEDTEQDVRWAAVGALGRLSEAILQTVAAQLEDPVGNVSRAAVDALASQANIPEPILQAVAALLEDPEGGVRQAAVHVLGGQSALPEPILQAVAARLGDPEENVRWAAVDALGRQSTLPEPILQAVAERLEHPEGNVRWAAVDALGRQSTLPEPILQAVTARLEDPEGGVSRAAMSTLCRQPTLPEPILQGIALRLESERASNFAEAILRRHGEFYSTLLNGRFVKSLYGILLRHSFEEQVSWYVEDGSSCVSMPEGFRRASLQNQEDQFRAMVTEARPRDFPLMDGRVSNGGSLFNSSTPALS